MPFDAYSAKLGGGIAAARPRAGPVHRRAREEASASTPAAGRGRRPWDDAFPDEDVLAATTRPRCEAVTLGDARWGSASIASKVRRPLRERRVLRPPLPRRRRRARRSTCDRRLHVDRSSRSLALRAGKMPEGSYLKLAPTRPRTRTTTPPSSPASAAGGCSRLDGTLRLRRGPRPRGPILFVREAHRAADHPRRAERRAREAALFASGHAATAIDGPWLMRPTSASTVRFHVEPLPLIGGETGLPMKPPLTVEAVMLSPQGRGEARGARLSARWLGGAGVGRRARDDRRSGGDVDCRVERPRAPRGVHPPGLPEGPRAQGAEAMPTLDAAARRVGPGAGGHATRAPRRAAVAGPPRGGPPLRGRASPATAAAFAHAAGARRRSPRARRGLPRRASRARADVPSGRSCGRRAPRTGTSPMRRWWSSCSSCCPSSRGR